MAQFKFDGNTFEVPWNSQVTFQDPLREDEGLHVPVTAFEATFQIELCDPTPIKGGVSTRCSTPVTRPVERSMRFPAGREPINVEVGPVVRCGPPGSKWSSWWAKKYEEEQRFRSSP
jgi:hypothetical protein